MDKLTAKQLSEWEAYSTLEPIGEWRADFRMASLSALMVNLFKRMPGSKKGQKDSEASDFMPEWYKEEVTPDNVEKQTSKQMKNILLDSFNISKKRRRKGDPPIKRKKT